MKISKAVTETKTKERNSLVNQVEIKYEMFCIGWSAPFLVIPKVDTFMDIVLVKVAYGDSWCSYTQHDIHTFNR